MSNKDIKEDTYCQSLRQRGSELIQNDGHNVFKRHISKAIFQIDLPSSEQVQSISKGDLGSEWNRETDQFLLLPGPETSNVKSNKTH